MEATDILKFVGPERNDRGRLSVAAFQHRAALDGRYTAPQGAALRKLLEGWIEYAAAYQADLGSDISDDGVLGDEWLAIGRAINGLLNGDSGGWDCGSIHSNIRDAIESRGWKMD